MYILKTKQEYEILSQILHFANGKKSLRSESKLAQKLIAEFGSLKEVLDADIKELHEYVSAKEASFINFIKECAPLYISLKIKERHHISSPRDVVDYLKARLSGEKVEKLYIVLFDGGNKIIDIMEVESGTINKSFILPRKIANLTLKLNAAAIIVCHNHPSGTKKPSDNDIQSTEKLKNALNLIDVSLLDHIIIANNDYLSFKEY